MKTKILNTPQGTIVKIDNNLSTFDRIHNKQQKLHGTLYPHGCDGDYSVFSNVYHAERRRFIGATSGLSSESKHCASMAMKWLVARASALGYDGFALPPGWVAEVRQAFTVPSVVLRYAFNICTYTAPAVAPALP